MSILINVILSVVSLSLYTIIAFWAGFGSNDNYAVYAWVLFGAFVLIHVLVFSFIANRKGELRSVYYLTGIVTTLIMYSAVIYYYSS